MLLASLNWSARAQSFFSNVGIGSIQQLIEKSPHEVLKYRNVGSKTLVEIRHRLGALGLSLQGDRVWTLATFGDNYDELIKRKAALEIELATVCEQITDIEQARELDKALAKPIDEDAIYADWKQGGSFAKLAENHSTRPDVVSEICWSRLETDCASGHPPALTRKVERQFPCSSCGARIVVRYQGEPRFPGCPSCGRKSKHYFR
jgi:hypothetical protein